MKIDFPAGLMLVQDSQKRDGRPVRFGVLVSIEWAEDTYIFTINWSEGFNYEPERVKFQDMGGLGIIPISKAISLLDQVPPVPEATLDDLKTQHIELQNVYGIFKGYCDDLGLKINRLTKHIAEVQKG